MIVILLHIACDIYHKLTLTILISNATAQAQTSASSSFEMPSVASNGIQSNYYSWVIPPAEFQVSVILASS